MVRERMKTGCYGVDTILDVREIYFRVMEECGGGRPVEGTGKDKVVIDRDVT